MSQISNGGEQVVKSKPGPCLAPIAVLALSFGYAVGRGAFVMPGTMFLPGAGPAGTVIGIHIGAAGKAVAVGTIGPVLAGIT